MKNDLGKYPQLLRALEENKLVYIFGPGISSALTGARYSWYKWIVDGINSLNDRALATALENKPRFGDSTENMIAVVGDY